MRTETEEVTIEKIFAADPYVDLVLNLANSITIGNMYQHYSLLKDLISRRVGWNVPESRSADGQLPWWMMSQAAYEVTIQAIGSAIGIETIQANTIAKREIE